MKNQVDITKITGLTEQEAQARLQQEGFNELPAGKKRSVFAIALKILSEPMFILLIAGGLLYFILGDAKQALVLVSFVFVIMGITFYQENKTERALEALRNLSSPRALVIRDGVEKRIAGRDVVTDDIIVVHEGDYVPADAKLIYASNLAVDESLLTGESMSVDKLVGDDGSIYASTLVVHGYGIAKVYGTALNTKIGSIGKALQTIKPEQTLLQKSTLKLVRNLAIIGLSVCVLVVLLYGITRGGDWLNGVLAGITLAMAILPEEFPVILTTFLALGAWRISKANVLTRRVPAVEALGAATVLCVDKTGTLTINDMRISAVCANNKILNINEIDKKNKVLPEDFHELIEYSILASQKDPFDPMEKAIKGFGEQYLYKKEYVHKNWRLVHEYPLSQDLFAISHVWQAPADHQYEIATKGAPEAIIELCHLDKKQADAILAKVKTMAQNGLRVLGVAKAQFDKAKLPKEQHDFNFEFIGLIGLADPIRDNVPDAIQQCYNAGMRVVMITGDYAETAMNIAKQIGLENVTEVITGTELQQMSKTELRKRIKKVNIFARIVPEQKLLIVQALKANKEIVAMTGDGVNDAPALKAADIGVAMGGRGTDVAREAASLVLLDDDFSSIVTAVKLGRRIFDNIRKAITYTLAVHIPIIGLTLFPIIFKLPLILLPVHIVFLELIIDPACSLIFEAEAAEKDVMSRAPRNSKEAIVNKSILRVSLFQGLLVLVLTMAVFGIAKGLGMDANAERTLTFTALVLMNLSLIFTNRAWSRSAWAILRMPNKALWWIISGALIFLGLIIYVPALYNIFHFEALNFTSIIICVLAAGLSFLIFEIKKKFTRSV